MGSSVLQRVIVTSALLLRTIHEVWGKETFSLCPLGLSFWDREVSALEELSPLNGKPRLDLSAVLNGRKSMGFVSRGSFSHRTPKINPFSDPIQSLIQAAPTFPHSSVRHDTELWVHHLTPPPPALSPSLPSPPSSGAVCGGWALFISGPGLLRSLDRWEPLMQRHDSSGPCSLLILTGPWHQLPVGNYPIELLRCTASTVPDTPP